MYLSIRTPLIISVVKQIKKQKHLRHERSYSSRSLLKIRWTKDIFISLIRLTSCKGPANFVSERPFAGPANTNLLDLSVQLNNGLRWIDLVTRWDIHFINSLWVSTAAGRGISVAYTLSYTTIYIEWNNKNGSVNLRVELYL